MIKVVILNNIARRELTGIAPTTTLRQIIEDAHNTDILFGGTYAVNGMFITEDDFDSPVSEFAEDNFMTIVTVKQANNA